MSSTSTPSTPAQEQTVQPQAAAEIDYRLMIDTIADYAIYHIDPAGYVRSWNNGARLMKGYEASEIIGRNFAVFYPPELLDRQWPEYELRVATEVGRFEDEGWRIRKDGSRFWASVIITKLVDATGNFRGFAKVTRDLSERRRHDELLRQSEERFRLLVEGVRDYAIFMLDPAGHVISWNNGARLNKGYEAAEIIGKHFSIFYPEDVAASGWPDAELTHALANGRYEEEGWRLRKDGSRFWANVVITALHDHTGKHRGFAKITRDLTEKRRVSVLEDEGRRIAAFIAMLAHELRNPLAPISNAIAIMDMERELSPPVQMTRDIISRQTKQLTRLVDDLLDMSRISAGKIHLEAKPVLLNGVIAEAVEAARPLIDANAHSIGIDVKDDVWVNGDRGRLVQIINNLLNNSAKFTPRGGNIELSLNVEDGEAVIRVRDNGLGIAKDRLANIFNRFMQHEDDSTKTFGGLGLGLSLVQQLTLAQGGHVSAVSNGVVGEGSEFLVRLPSIAAPSDQAGRQVALKTILVVDDNVDSADTLALLLTSMGYRTLTANTGTAALERVKSEQPDAVLLDIGLPDIDGIQVAERITADMRNPPVLIAVTGYGMDKDRERSFNTGFHAHMTKPVDPAKLQTMLRLVLNQPA